MNAPKTLFPSDMAPAQPGVIPKAPVLSTASRSRASAVDCALADVEKNWNEFGKRDPLWAILTEESKRDNGWDPAEFFATGEREIASVLAEVEKLNFSLARGRALDFGCGVGRLTQALCRHFEECHGVYIAESMVAKAREYNRQGARCHYHVNAKSDLSLFADNTFDFIYSNLVLQHNRPEASLNFIREFLRVLAPGGLLLFQLPSEPVAESRGGGVRLKDAAFRALVSVEETETLWTAGRARRLSVTVRNTSPETWPGRMVSGKFPVKLGNHWRDGRNKMIVNDDARADLPHDLKPGEEIKLHLRVSVPGEPGHYRLELDMVQEDVAWFADKGSPTRTLEIEVQPATAAAKDAPRAAAASGNLPGTAKPEPAGGGNSPAVPPVIVPRMEMNGIAKARVLEFLAQHGGNPLSVLTDAAATGWLGYRYFVTKGRPSAATAPEPLSAPARPLAAGDSQNSTSPAKPQKSRILVAIPIKPTLCPPLMEKCQALAGALPAANPDHEIVVIFDYQSVAKEPGDCRPWSRVARARNRLLDTIKISSFDYVLWIDADVVSYPANLPSILVRDNPGGVSAPMIYIEDSDLFYDWAANIIKDQDHLEPENRDRIFGRNLQPEYPYWPQAPSGTLVELACTGTIILVPSEVYAAGARYEDHPAFTDHYSICKMARNLGRKVCVNLNVTAYHADLPKYGEAWH